MFELLAEQPAVFWLAILSAILMVVGALGPWATALNIVPISGTRGDGVIVVAAALVGTAGLWGSVWRRSLWLGLLAILCGAAAAAVSAIDLSKLSSIGATNFFGRQLQLVSPGWGIYLDVGASMALVGFVTFLLVRRRSSAPIAAPVVDTAASALRSNAGASLLGTPTAVHPVPVLPAAGSTAAARPTPGRSDRPSPDRGILIAAGVAGVLVLIVLGAVLYVGGVFSSTGNSSTASAGQSISTPPIVARSTTASPPPNGTGSAGTSPSTTTTSSPTPVAPVGAPSATPILGPADTLRRHLQDLGSGRYQAAFDLTSDQYQSQNPSWVSDRAAADPVIDVISLSSSGGTQVNVDFYAHDRNPTSGSDTQCREFQGTANMTKTGTGWRYDPSGSSLSATVVPASDPHCLG